MPIDEHGGWNRQRLWDCKKPYYCETGDYWHRSDATRHYRYESAAEFLAGYGRSDTDCNLVFRWEWACHHGNGGDADVEPTQPDPARPGVFSFWSVVQRKGYMASGEVSVTDSDEPEISNWLRSRWAKLNELWLPMSAEPLEEAESQLARYDKAMTIISDWRTRQPESIQESLVALCSIAQGTPCFCGCHISTAD